MFRGLLPHVCEHVLEGFHVLRGISHKTVLRKTRYVNLHVPRVLSLQQRLMQLVGFVDLVLCLPLDGPDADDSIANPLHVTHSPLSGADDSIHFLLGVKDA